MSVHLIDRIDQRGDIRQHAAQEGAEATLCGQRVGLGNTQKAIGNSMCLRCRRLLAARGLADNCGPDFRPYLTARTA